MRSEGASAFGRDPFLPASTAREKRKPSAMAHRAPSCASSVSSVSSVSSSSSRWAAEPRPPSPSSDEGENESEEEEKEERVAAVWLPALVRQGRRDVAARVYEALLPQLIDAARNARATVVLRHAPSC